MERNKQTPGPWSMDTSLHIYGEVQREVTLAEKQRGLVGITDRPHVATVNTYADARLIAAAPELLAALVEVAEWASKGSDLPGRIEGLIVRAVAKAKGETA